MKKSVINNESSDSLRWWVALSESKGCGYIYQCNYKWLNEVSFYHVFHTSMDFDNVVAIFKVRGKTV